MDVVIECPECGDLPVFKVAVARVESALADLPARVRKWR